MTIFQNISNLRDVFYKEMSKVGGQTAPQNTSPLVPHPPAVSEASRGALATPVLATRLESSLLFV